MRRSLGARPLAAYAIPAAGYSFYLFFSQFYFLKFSTDVLLAPPAIMGILFGAGRIWDAVSDPLVGYWSDRTRSSLGRRRPWMLAGIPLLALSFAAVWVVPEFLGGIALVLWVAFSMVAFFTAYTIYSIPHTSLGAELSSDHHERTRIFGAQRVAFVVGMMIAFGAIGYASNDADPRRAVRVVVVAAALLASAALLLAPTILRERPSHRGRGAGSPFGAFRDVTRNRHARILLVAWFVDGLGMGVLGVLAPYLAEYVLERPDLIAVIPASFVIAGIASVPVWIALSRRFGKRPVWRVAVLGGGLSFGATFFVGSGDVALVTVLLIGAGASTGCSGAVGQSMLADTIDYDELETGERKEGAYSAAWGFAFKLAIGATVMLAGAVLQASGFRPNVEQTPSALLALSGLFAGAPLLGSVAAFTILRGYSLDEATHAKIREELDRRAR